MGILLSMSSKNDDYLSFPSENSFYDQALYSVTEPCVSSRPHELLTGKEHHVSYNTVTGQFCKVRGNYSSLGGNREAHTNCCAGNTSISVSHNGGISPPSIRGFTQGNECLLLLFDGSFCVVEE